jgi:type I thyroxine 5'-deiodinase
MAADYKSSVNFLTVYIAEAHASDEWPIGSAVSYEQTRSHEARAQAAKDMIRDLDYRLPLLLDDPRTNAFDSNFASWPLRFYILQNNKVVYKAQPRDCTYSIEELEQSIQRAIAPTSDRE